MKAVFCLTNARSGTRFLCGLLRRNARGCVVRHETFLDPGNPSMFGRPIYDHWAGDYGALRALLERKRAWVARRAPGVYVETSHAFLKSYWDIAPDFFPEVQLIHLIRNPLEAARSEATHRLFLQQWRVPFRHYRGGDGRKYFQWGLTGRERIFSFVDRTRMNAFQRCLLEWIEVENRAMKFLERLDRQHACFTLHCFEHLNDAQRIALLLRFLELEPSRKVPVLSGSRNRTPGRPTRAGPPGPT